MISYLIIVSDLLADLGRSVWGDCPQFFKDYRFWQAVVTVVVILPLCCVKKLDTMRFASLLAMVSVGYIVVLVVYFYFFGELSYEPEPIKLATFAPEAFAALPVFVFAFTCHVNLFPIYREMAHARFRRTQVVVIISLIICASIYIVVASFGYATAGPAVDSNIINNCAPATVGVARLSTSFLVTFSYPILLHPARCSLDTVVCRLKGDSWYPRVRFYTETLLLVGVTFFIAFFMRDLDFVLGVVGATSGSMISYVIPGWFYWVLWPAPHLHPRRLLAAALAFFGILLCVVCVTCLVLEEFF
eukprot:TRINITY_DN910_c0_g1_i12.p1 TRINITY_DN910_c0_g1~~TRINITY_DN910_c0_g1_i12.p1  ORF type:complete len:302 (-),score=55.64 TRINITY_DN910_c0_g1_i12:100-1005(-)